MHARIRHFHVKFVKHEMKFVYIRLQIMFAWMCMYVYDVHVLHFTYTEI